MCAPRANPISSQEILGVLSHHLKCEMKSPRLVDFSWDFVDFQSNLSQILADFWPILAEISPRLADFGRN